MNPDLEEKLKELAFKRTVPFCYGCYTEAPKGTCSRCGSDDLMRLFPGVGCEYGTDWVIKEILAEELEAVDLKEVFESHVADCYPETVQVGWLTLDVVTVLKEMDPVAWRCAQSEWESQEADDGNFITFDLGSNYYWRSDVETLLSS